MILTKSDSIELVISSDVNLNKWEKEIMAKVGAKKLHFEGEELAIKQEEKIKGRNFVISFRKL